MASPSELSLDCKPYTYSMLLKSFGDLHQSDQTQKLEEVLSCLEEERLKIDAFKRELPLCMQLLSDAVETSRQQLQAYRSNKGSAARPVLEEFIPLKTSPNSDQTSDKIITNPNSDKANWMTTAQLWSQDSIIVHETKPQSTPSPNNNNNNNCIQKVGSLDTKLQRNGGAFLPFSKERNLCSNNSTPSPNPTLALASSDHKESLMILEDKNHHKVIQCSDQSTDHHHHQMNGFSCPKRDSSSCKVEQGGNGGGNNSSSDGQVGNGTTSSASTNPNSQAHRKARRCWSPDLHRRFVNALQMLGGSQVATPKQIRELMKVDGLTNDEVKSHLQKYRLHTRRPSPSPQAAGAQAPQLVVLGGIWVPPEYATAAAHNGSTAALYGTHHHQVHHPATNSHAPPHFCGGASPQQLQEFYTTGASAAQMPPLPASHHHQMLLHHHQLQMYKPTSQQQPHSPPGSDMRGTAERSESIEDGKSESGSWKGESGDNGGERKGLAALRENGEESNGSEITLKF